jgi:uncharacterized membrane protein YgcG
MSGPLTIAADDRCSAHSDLCSRVELQSTTTIGDGSVHIDTVFYPREVESSTVASREDAPPPPLGAAVAGEASGVAVCYSGLLRGFGGNRSGALSNHARYLLRPLQDLFSGDVYVAFSTAYDGSGGRSQPANLALSPRVRSTLEAVAGIPPTHVIEEARPVNNGSNYMQAMSFGGLEHCGLLIRALRRRRAQAAGRPSVQEHRPFAFAVRLRYDLLVEPRVGGALLRSWPIWDPASPSPLLAFSKFVIDNSTSTRGLQLFGCPWQLPAKRCVPQDVFFVARASAALLGPSTTRAAGEARAASRAQALASIAASAAWAPAAAASASRRAAAAPRPVDRPLEEFFAAPHAPIRFWATEGLKARMHASERTLFSPLLERGVPLHVLWLGGGHCGWMLVDDRSVGDARAPRAVFRNRCTRLRRNASAEAASASVAADGQGTAPAATGARAAGAIAAADDGGGGHNGGGHNGGGHNGGGNSGGGNSGGGNSGNASTMSTTRPSPSPSPGPGRPTSPWMVAHLELAAACWHQTPSARPDMGSVMHQLESLQHANSDVPSSSTSSAAATTSTVDVQILTEADARGANSVK